MNQLKYCDENKNDEHIRIIQKKYLNLKLQQWMAGSVHADIYIYWNIDLKISIVRQC